MSMLFSDSRFLVRYTYTYMLVTSCKLLHSDQNAKVRPITLKHKLSFAERVGPQQANPRAKGLLWAMIECSASILVLLQLNEK